MRLSFLMLCATALASAPVAAADYRLGERLPQAQQRGTAPAAVREISWEELVPKDWNPRDLLKGIDLAMLDDADPRAMRALEKLREVWSNAPANAALNGARIRIPGFVVPLEQRRSQVSEFLLVPYFGACIHSPPPPSNQIIHVFPAGPLGQIKTMDVVWVEGTLAVARSETGMGNAGYQLKAVRVTPYRRP